MKRLHKISLLLLLLFVGLFYSCDKESTELISKKVPDFLLPGPAKTQVNMAKYAGKVRLVVFWATWCQPCVMEIPSLVQLQDTYGPQGFQVLSINVDEKPETVIPQFLKKWPLNYPVAYGDDATSRNFGGVSSLPASFLLNGRGELVKRFDGFTAHRVLEEEIRKLLSLAQGSK